MKQSIILLLLLSFVISEEIQPKEKDFFSYLSTFLSDEDALQAAGSVFSYLQNGEISQAIDTTVDIVENVVLTTMLDESEPNLEWKIKIKNPFKGFKDKIKKIKDLIKKPSVKALLDNTLKDVISKGLSKIPYATEVCSLYCSVDKGVHKVCNYC